MAMQTIKKNSEIEALMKQGLRLVHNIFPYSFGDEIEFGENFWLWEYNSDGLAVGGFGVHLTCGKSMLKKVVGESIRVNPHDVRVNGSTITRFETQAVYTLGADHGMKTAMNELMALG